MCLTSPYRDHLEVMSSGDSSLVPSSIPPSTDTNTQTPTTQKTENKRDDITSSPIHLNASTLDRIDSISDTSGLDLQEEQSMAPTLTVSGISDSIHLQREVTSLDAVSLDEEVGELFKKENRSAFEITSFRPADTDEGLDRSVRNPVLTDSIPAALHEKVESEDSLLTPNEKMKYDESESSLRQDKVKFVLGEEVQEEVLEVENRPQGALISSSSSKLGSDDTTTTVTTLYPIGPPSGSGTGTAVGNGSSVQPNRFRRVNQYDRGRWLVRDTLVTEEQAESIPSYQKQDQHCDFNNTSLTTTQNRTDLVPELQPLTDLGLGALSSVVGGGVALNDTISDKDSSSIHMDQSSITAETLSRNTSMSSILAVEKLDENLDVESDSITGGVGTNHDTAGQESQENANDQAPVASPHPPVVPTSSVGSVPPPSSTNLPREGQQPTSVASATLVTTTRETTSVPIVQEAQQPMSVASVREGQQPMSVTSVREGQQPTSVSSVQQLTSVASVREGQQLASILSVREGQHLTSVTKGQHPTLVASIREPTSVTSVREGQQPMSVVVPSAPAEVEHLKRVEDAMFSLQNELYVLTSSSYPLLLEENRNLKDQRAAMDMDNHNLREQLKATMEELKTTKDDNKKLKKELAELRQSLSRLASSSSYSTIPGTPVDNSSTDAMTQSSGTEQLILPTVSSDNNDSPNSPPPHGSIT